MLCTLCVMVTVSSVASPDTAGLDLQTGTVQPYFVQGRRGLMAEFYVPIIPDRTRENAECFYMTLRSPQNGDSYDPEIRTWTPSRAIGWIQSENNSMLVNKGCIYACVSASVDTQLIIYRAEEKAATALADTEVQKADTPRL